MVRYTYRLRPGRQALAALEREAGMARWVWNQCVATDRDRRSAGERSPSGYDMKKLHTGWRSEHAWLAEGSSVVQQEAVLDWGRARKASFTVKGRRPPTFKAKHRTSPSLQYTRSGFVIRDGRLRLANGIVLPVVWSRKLPSDPTSVRVYRDTVGDWWASFVVEREPERFPPAAAAIGIDWGVRTVATATDERFDLEHPQHERRAHQRRARYQRMMARRQPERRKAPSSGYREAKRAHAKVCRKVARQRQDTARKWARSVVERHEQIAVEDFRPKFMTKSTLARKAADAAIGAAKRELLLYGKRAGRDVVLVPPAYTTTDCSGCGARAKRLTLAERTYRCPACGLVLPRDRNSARVILAAAGFDGACAESVRREPPPGDLAA